VRTHGYEKSKSQRVVGQTKTSGFQIGVRRTFPVSVQDAWQFLTSTAGINIWLGELSTFSLTKGETYTTKDDTKGEVRVVNVGENIRLTWLPQNWQKASTVQVRTIPHGPNTVISFHQEGLPGAKERENMRQHWRNVLEKLETYLNQNISLEE
jgi:uncharacterized protein YndB with AHSA1/START domain